MVNFLTSDLISVITFFLSLVGSIYASYQAIKNYVKGRFKLFIDISELSDLTERTLVRANIVNKSTNDVVISTFDIFSNNSNLYLEGEKYGHYIKMMKYLNSDSKDDLDNFTHPIFSSEFPIHISGKGAKSVILMLEGNHIKESDLPLYAKIRTSKGIKKVKINSISKKKPAYWFS